MGVNFGTDISLFISRYWIYIAPLLKRELTLFMYTPGHKRLYIANPFPLRMIYHADEMVIF